MNEKFFYNPNEKVWKCFECGYKNYQSFFDIMGGHELSPNVFTSKILFCPKCDARILEKWDSRTLENGSVITSYVAATPE